MLFISPCKWNDYQLIDSGNFEKLEKFGKYILIRPEPQAIWDKSLSEKEWLSRASLKFIFKSNNSGVWQFYQKMPEDWDICFERLNISCKLKLTSFKHVGVFPEQAANWDYISAINKSGKGLKILNLFAYTGMSSLASNFNSNQVTHVDSVKQVVSWAKENMIISGQSNIRWIIEDARKFVNREISRGNKYNGIILDPPAFGKGTKGENWKLEKDLNDLLKSVEQLLDKNKYFLILNTYSLGFSSVILENIVGQIFKSFNCRKEYGELMLEDSFGKKLPLGVFARFNNIIE